MLDIPPEFDYHYAEARQFNLHLTDDIDFTQFLPFAKLDAWMMREPFFLRTPSKTRAGF